MAAKCDRAQRRPAPAHLQGDQRPATVEAPARIPEAEAKERLIKLLTATEIVAAHGDTCCHMTRRMQQMSPYSAYAALSRSLPSFAAASVPAY